MQHIISMDRGTSWYAAARHSESDFIGENNSNNNNVKIELIIWRDDAQTSELNFNGFILSASQWCWEQRLLIFVYGWACGVD